MTHSTKLLPVVFLHGFTGSSDLWFPVLKELDGVCDPITINLVGHGSDEPSEDVADYTMDAQIDRIRSIADTVKLEKFVLAGYSMGARIALHFAVKYPDRLSGLILESGTAGIEDPAAREHRKKSDKELAKFIETEGVETFVNKWMNLPLFASQSRLPEETYSDIKKQKLNNSKIALANTLRAAGTGQMQPLWDYLPQLSIPVLLITGEIDEKFTDLNVRMAREFPNCKHAIVEDVGHTVHLEDPQQYAKLIADFIRTLINP